jgi:hypothetical protein
MMKKVSPRENTTAEAQVHSQLLRNASARSFAGAILPANRPRAEGYASATALIVVPRAASCVVVRAWGIIARRPVGRASPTAGDRFVDPCDGSL